MFTGIVSDVGKVVEMTPIGELRRLAVASAYDPASIEVGASIANAGVCLTVVGVEKRASGSRISFDVGAETLAVTTLGAWRKGTHVNLERSLKLGDELGGHLVAGHVDGVGRLISTRDEGDSIRLVFEAPGSLAPGIASKGSIAVDGVSLTVNEVTGARFGVNIIPHTRAVTSLGSLKVGDAVNLELDLIARYVARLMGKDLQ